MRSKIKMLLPLVALFSIGCQSGSSSSSTTPVTYGWMNGSDTINTIGVYGTQGVSSATNVPGARERAISWTDNNGNLWLFSGEGFSSESDIGHLNDLWKYNIATNQWTWISGSNVIDESGIYGTKGTASTTNVPGARSASISWVDNSGNLWLLGGHGFDALGVHDELNDLWKYNITTNEWTWVGGSNVTNESGIYGTKGTAAAANAPGARSGSISWVDNSGNLWLFGGDGFDSESQLGHLNDLWKYNVTSNMWTWVNGSNVIDESGIYGTKGTAAATNVPGARSGSISWVDSSGNLWLFGGHGFDSVGEHEGLNDLWKYNITTNEWTWMGGSNTAGASGIYGVQGTASLTNIPGARARSISWVDNNGNLWLLGGDGVDSVGVDGHLNDVWEYNPNNFKWTWVGGSNLIDEAGVYGSLGVTAATNIPGARDGAISWTDNNGNLWLLGGHGFDAQSAHDVLNDLWQIKLN